MDTPACPRPGDPRQQEILDSLILIRDKLLLLKCDDTTHIKSQDVLNLYDELLEQVRQLGETNALNDTPGETQRVFSLIHPSIRICAVIVLTLTCMPSGQSPRELLPAHLARVHDDRSQQ